MNRYIFSLFISADNWLQFYRMPNATVVARATTGQKVQFKARHLQKHITHNGIDGVFCLTIDQNHDFVSLERIEY